MRILYVEDNMANLYLVKRIAHGHEVINYIDGEEALRRIAQDKPDLIFMDIQLVGELTGLDVVRKLREQGMTTPIVAVTAYAMVGDRETCLAAGCDDYLAKPLPVPEVLALIQKYDPAHRATRETPAVGAQPPAPAISDDADEAPTAPALAISDDADEAPTAPAPAISDDADEAPTAPVTAAAPDAAPLSSSSSAAARSDDARSDDETTTQENSISLGDAPLSSSKH